MQKNGDSGTIKNTFVDVIVVLITKHVIYYFDT